MKINVKFVKITLLASSTLTVMSGATIAASLPLIKETFSDNPDSDFLSKLILTLPALFIAIISPIAGVAVDKIGRKTLLIVSLILYGIGGSLGGLVDSLMWILVSRGLLGIAVAIVMTVTSTLIADYFEGEERSNFLGQQAAAMAIGGILFISLGGVLAEMSWRGPFFIYGLSLLIVIPAIRFIKEPEKMESDGSANLKSIEPKPRNAILFLLLLIFVTMVFFYMMPVQVPFILNKIGVSSTKVGLAIAAGTLSGAISSLAYKKLNTNFHTSWLYMASFLIMGIGYVLIASFDTFIGITASLFIAGFGNGLIMPNTTALVMNVAPNRVRGTIMGLLSAFMFLGQFFSPILIQPLADATTMNSAFLYAGLAMAAMGVGFFIYNITTKDNTLLKLKS
ncbi:MFS transporter [Maribacter sp. 2-571]|uniref:MFS transporter n=1 Tax=Maribacter sp. 2-571 TaxID=3417569 RepID=UPI003D34F6F1